MAISIDTRDQIEILTYYRKFLTMQESSQFFSRNGYYENTPFEERPATANSALAVFKPQVFPAMILMRMSNLITN